VERAMGRGLAKIKAETKIGVHTKSTIAGGFENVEFPEEM